MTLNAGIRFCPLHASRAGGKVGMKMGGAQRASVSIACETLHTCPFELLEGTSVVIQRLLVNNCQAGRQSLTKLQSLVLCFHNMKCKESLSSVVFLVTGPISATKIL